MQDATDNLTRALSGDAVTWRPEVYVDWANDGYGDEDTIDDLTNQVGRVTVKHSMDDGLPDEISFLSGGVPTMGAGVDGRDQLNAAQYWSPFRTDSPVYGYERDLAPAKTDIAVVTAGGLERTRLFTGRTQDVPVRGGRATISAVSETRLLLAQLVQLPVHVRNVPITYLRFGLTASYPVVYSMYKCGIHAAPPAQDGTRLYMPLHGGGFAFVPDANPLVAPISSGFIHGFSWGPGVPDSLAGQTDPIWIRGPYVGAMYGKIETNSIIAGLGGTFTELEPGDPFWTTTGSTGRWEMWVRGDTFADVNTTPGGSAYFRAAGPTGSKPVIAGIGLNQSSNGSGLQAGVGSDRLLYVQLWDSGVQHYHQGPALPADGEWHFVGIAWSGTRNKIWFNLDGTVTTATPSPAIITANLSTGVNDEGDAISGINVFIPTAEMHLTAGTVADPDTGNPWVVDQDWTARADVYPSCLQLEALLEEKPSEAFQLISEYARAELAALTIDEHDVIHYWPRGYFGTDASQVTTQALDTERHAALPDVALDRSKIRTVCRITFPQTYVVDERDYCLQLQSGLAFPAGDTLFRIGLDVVTTRLRAGELINLTADQLDGTDPFGPQQSFISVYSNPDSLFAPLTEDQVLGTVVDWNCKEALILIQNMTGATAYITNVSSLYPFMGLYGSNAVINNTNVTEQYEAGVDLRGQIALTLSMNRIQREEDATRMARRIVVGHSRPIPVVSGVELFGDPTRQVGDLVTFTDEDQTGADGSWRVFSLEHNSDGALYTQQATLQKTPLRGTWGDGVSEWGRVVWGGQEPVL